jgi:ERCC4-related helicase
MKEQQIVLEQFDSGHVNVLCATTVAEEGLDIRKCNCIITYNQVCLEEC